MPKTKTDSIQTISDSVEAVAGVAAAPDDALAGSTPDAIPESAPARENTDVRHLFHRLHGPPEALRFGDRESLRDHLVLQHAPLVEHCARNFVASGEPVEDLVQEGYVGLIKAVDRFDPDKGVRFSTYACHLITGEIRHYLRDLGRLIHEPGWHFELRQRISRTSDQLSQKLGRTPEPEEVALALNIEPQSVRDVLRNQQTLTVEYLDAESDRDSDDGSGGGDWDRRMTASATTPEASETRIEDQQMLGLALPQLRELEKRAITLFFFEDLSKTEIARRLDVSVNHAAYLIKRGVDGLREIIDSSEEGAALEDMSSGRLKQAAQSRTRAAYLLELTKGGLKAKNGAASTPARKGRGRASRRSMRLMEKLPSTLIPAPKNGVASFTEFALWVDEEARRAARYAQEFSLLWLRVANWESATEHFDETQNRRALSSMQALARRCCRATDKIATLSTSELPGLHLLVLMPHTGEKGRKTGERWEEAARTLSLLPDEDSQGDSQKQLPLESKFAFVVFPGDGRSSDELFRAMGEQLALDNRHEAGDRRHEDRQD